jgi:predicted TIM-barrel fold metal-dependent hydrolase
MTHGMIRTIMSTTTVATLCACAPSTPTYRGEPVSVVDMHLHTGTWDDIPPPMQEFLAARFPFPVNLAPEGVVNDVLSAQGIIDQLDDAGIEKGILFAVYAPQTVGLTTNEFVAARVDEGGGRLLGFGSLPLEGLATSQHLRIDELRAAIESYDLRGIKLAHPHAQAALDEPAQDAIYALAGEKGVPVYLHTGNTPAVGARIEETSTSPRFLQRVIVGYDFIDHDVGDLDVALDLAATHDNVYLEASALGSAGSDPEGTNYGRILSAIRERGLANKLVYGSDGPQRPGFVKDYLQRTLAALDAADYELDEVRGIMKDNLAGITSID